MKPYRGYRIEPGVGGEYDIRDREGCLIDGAPTVGEAEKIIDGWLDAR